jgi:hypothetical protein
VAPWQEGLRAGLCHAGSINGTRLKQVTLDHTADRYNFCWNGTPSVGTLDLPISPVRRASHPKQFKGTPVLARLELEIWVCSPRWGIDGVGASVPPFGALGTGLRKFPTVQTTGVYPRMGMIVILV